MSIYTDFLPHFIFDSYFCWHEYLHLGGIHSMLELSPLSKPHIAVDDNLNAEVDFYIFSHTFHFYLSIAIWPCWLCIVFNTYDIYKIS